MAPCISTRYTRFYLSGRESLNYSLFGAPRKQFADPRVYMTLRALARGASVPALSLLSSRQCISLDAGASVRATSTWFQTQWIRDRARCTSRGRSIDAKNTRFAALLASAGICISARFIALTLKRLPVVGNPEKLAKMLISPLPIYRTVHPWLFQRDERTIFYFRDRNVALWETLCKRCFYACYYIRNFLSRGFVSVT